MIGQNHRSRLKKTRHVWRFGPGALMGSMAKGAARVGIADARAGPTPPFFPFRRVRLLQLGRPTTKMMLVPNLAQASGVRESVHKTSDKMSEAIKSARAANERQAHSLDKLNALIPALQGGASPSGGLRVPGCRDASAIFLRKHRQRKGLDAVRLSAE